MPAELPEVLARVNGQPVTKFDFEPRPHEVGIASNRVTA
jgi:hypothetical protein